MFLLENMVGLKVGMYVKNVFLPIILTSIASVILPIVAYRYIEPGFLRFAVVCLVSVVSVSLAAIYIGMTSGERNAIVNGIIKKIIKR